MLALLRRLTLGFVLGSSFVGIGVGQEGAFATHEGCDHSYPDICLPSAPRLTCDDVGYPIRVFHDSINGANDPHYLDPDFNGIGCEGY